MAYFADLREYLGALEEKGKLFRFQEEMIPETQMAPLVMLQYRGLPESQWRSFLFENVVGVRGRKYDNRVLMGSPASREILAIGLKCSPDEMKQAWVRGRSNPIAPEIVDTGPVHEVIVEGEELERVGLEGIASPVEAPGYSGQTRTTTQVVTRDPETGINNVGEYSAHFAGRTEMRLAMAGAQHGNVHHTKWRRLGKRLEVAIVIGATPNLALAASAPLPYGVDEYSVAGGMVGEAMKLTRCRTVDLEVPAAAEMVIEGEMTDQMEAHAAFSDYPGYLDDVANRFVPVMKVKCITHRRNPIFQAQDIGYPPTSTTVLEVVAAEVSLYHHLTQALNTPGVLDVACHYVGGARNYIVIQMKKSAPWDPWQALNAVAAFSVTLGKITIVVDEDINPWDPEAVNWALAFRMQPHRDIRIITHRAPLLDPSAYPPGATSEQRRFPPPSGGSAILIDATRKWAYAPVGMPSKEYMEQALALWKAKGMPTLTLREPWHGYELGAWREEDVENARMVTSGEYLELWKKLNQNRVPVSGPL